jgi:hypothetical protein
VLDTDFGNMGDDKEAYRWNFLIKNHRARDNYSDIMAMAQTFSLNDDAFAGQIERVIDVDQWMRFFAYQSLGAVADAYNVSHPHNLKLYVRPDDRCVEALPWDTDRAFSNSATSAIYGSSGSRLQKVIAIGAYKRRFLWHLYDIVTTTYRADYIADWVHYYADVSGQDATNTILSCIETRRAYVLDQLPRRIPFEITGPNLEGRTVRYDSVTLTGTAWLDVADIRMAGSDESLDVMWGDVTGWMLTLPFEGQTNTYTLEAYDNDGQLLASDSIIITR